MLIPSIVLNTLDLDPRVYVIYNSNNDIQNKSVFFNTGIEPVMGKDSFLKSAAALYKFASMNRQETFQVYNIGPLFLLILRLAGARKIIYCIHGTMYWKTFFQKVLRKLLWSLSLSGNIVFISNTNHSGRVFRELISETIHPITVYNPIDIMQFEADKEKYPDRPRKIIYTGRLTTGKNLFLWIDVAKALLEKFSDIQYEIYGYGGIRNDLEKYAEKQGLKDKITFHGFIRDIATAYKNGDLLLFLSEYESFGNVVIESILAGTPVICSNIPSMQEIFANYPSFIVDLDQHLKENIISKIENYRSLIDETVKARREFKEKFSIEKHTSRLRGIYSELQG